MWILFKFTIEFQCCFIISLQLLKQFLFSFFPLTLLLLFASTFSFILTSPFIISYNFSLTDVFLSLFLFSFSFSLLWFLHICIMCFTHHIAFAKILWFDLFGEAVLQYLIKIANFIFCFILLHFFMLLHLFCANYSTSL